ncbi:MAG TPA: lysozyme [Dehalococcoidia bacterium]|nr:lysozyme [Dehalococcoidia bacterium]
MRAGPFIAGGAVLLGAIALASKSKASQAEADAFPGTAPTPPSGGTGSWWDQFRFPSTPASSTAAVPRPWRASAAGIDLIADLEGFEPYPFFDVKQCAIGYGTKLHPGQCAGDEGYPNGITVSAARGLLQARADDASKVLERYVTVTLSQPQVDALTSFVYNVGSGNFASSTLLRKLNEGKYARVPTELKKWVYANKQKMGGLVARREREAAVWNTA